MLREKEYSLVLSSGKEEIFQGAKSPDEEGVVGGEGPYLMSANKDVFKNGPFSKFWVNLKLRLFGLSRFVSWRDHNNQLRHAGFYRYVTMPHY
jgi:hypothetical protein